MSPISIIFTLLNQEIPDEERRRGVVMKTLTVIEINLKRIVAFSNRQTNIPSITSGLEKGMGPNTWLALTAKTQRNVS